MPDRQLPPGDPEPPSHLLPEALDVYAQLRHIDDRCNPSSTAEYANAIVQGKVTAFPQRHELHEILQQWRESAKVGYMTTGDVVELLDEIERAVGIVTRPRLTFDEWWQTGEPQKILGERYNSLEDRDALRKAYYAGHVNESEGDNASV